MPLCRHPGAGLVLSPRCLSVVIPAQAGIHCAAGILLVSPRFVLFLLCHPGARVLPLVTPVLDTGVQVIEVVAQRHK